LADGGDGRAGRPTPRKTGGKIVRQVRMSGSRHDDDLVLKLCRSRARSMAVIRFVLGNACNNRHPAKRRAALQLAPKKDYQCTISSDHNSRRPGGRMAAQVVGRNWW